MAASAEAICNIASALLGHAPDLVTSITSTTNTTERLYAVLYPVARDSLLTEHPWKFATKRAPLVLNAAEPVFEYTYAYDLPSDYLNIVRTNLEADGSVIGSEWRIEGDTLVSNTAPGDEVTITGATQANPVVITAASHGISDGASVYIASVGGMTQINSLTFTVDNPTTSTLELKGIDGTGYTAYTSGGTIRQLNLEIEYVASITDTTAFPQMFTDLLAYRLAAMAAMRLTDNATMAEQAWQVYNRKLEIYLNRDSVQGVPRGIESDLWLVSRL